MFVHQGTANPPKLQNLPEFLTAKPAAQLAGVSAPTIRKILPPDAVYVSEKGDKQFGLWTRETVERFRAEREAAGQ